MKKIGLFFAPKMCPVHTKKEKISQKKTQKGPVHFLNALAQLHACLTHKSRRYQGSYNGAVRFQLVFTFDVQVLGLDDIAIFGLYAARMCAWVENVTYISGFWDTKDV